MTHGPSHPATLSPASHDLSSRPTEALENDITELAAHINAATHRLLTLVAEFDRRKGWGGLEIASCAHWLNFKCGIAIGAAREKVRVARALENLPAIDAAFARGTISYSKVRAMTRVATPANESYLLMIAHHGTASHVERAVRAYRGVLRAEENARASKQHEERSVTWFDDDDGSLIIRAHLPAESGARVLAAIEAVRVSLERAEGDGEEDFDAESASYLPGPAGGPPSARRADALVELAELGLSASTAGKTGGDRYQLVVHVNADVLADPEAEGRCELEHGSWLARETALRMGCDASLVRMIDGPGGEALDVGRKTRTIPPAIRRALTSRDRGCRFPGCTHTRYVDAHHVQHWADGGETRLGNLVTLCRRHHRLVHEGGFEVRALDDGAVRFTRPDGRTVPENPDVSAGTSGSIMRLRAQHAKMGLTVDARTAVTLWDGLRMDLGMVVDGLLQADRRGAPVP